MRLAVDHLKEPSEYSEVLWAEAFSAFKWFLTQRRYCKLTVVEEPKSAD